MNNEQFRRLAFGSGASSSSKKDDSDKTNNAKSAAPAILGSRQRSSIPMTPRAGGSVSQLAFAKQMAERFGGAGGDKNKQQQKKSKLSAPKGSRFAAGYVDRAKLRAEQEDDDSKSVPKGLDFGLLEKARNGEDILGEKNETQAKEDKEDHDDNDDKDDEPGPDVDDEFEQLEKTEVQAVAKEKTKKKGQYSTAPPIAGQKRSRDQILAEMKAAREAAKAAKAAQETVLGSRFKKIGATNMSHLPGSSRIERDSRGREVLVIVDEDGHEKRKVRKLSREELEAEAEAEEAPKSDGEVLGMEVPEFYRKKLEAEAAAEAEKEVNIFDDAGSDYDPLAGMGSASESDSESEKEEAKKEAAADKRRERSRSNSPRRRRDREDGEANDSDDSRYSRYSRDSRDSRDYRKSRRMDSRSRSRDSRDSRSRVSRDSRDYSRRDSRRSARSYSRSPGNSRRRSPAESKPAASTSTSTPRPAPPAETAPRRNYFGASKLLSEESRDGTSLNDPSVLAALRRAKQLREASEVEEKKEALSKEAEREARLKKLLQDSERDAEDMDLEFSVSRGGVEVEEDEERVRFSKWKGKSKGGGDEEEDDDDGKGGGKGGGQKRKRGGKKRMGDGNNAADVLRVLESRKGK